MAGPFVMIGMAINTMYIESGFDGVLMVFKCLAVMSIGVGFIASICYQVHKNNQDK
jgi:surface polysaccharide O-acyltransferase-like enzyme